MSTAVFEVARSIPLRIDELKRLTVLAQNAQTNNEDTYNTLCRACCVLLASHLEGFLKDFTRSLTADFNFYLKSFKNMPEAIKNTFCEKIAFYEGVPKDEVSQRAKQLVDFFSANSVAIDLHAFTYKESKNKNPGPNALDATLSKMGVPSVLRSMVGGRLENIFKNDTGATYAILRDMKRYRSRLYNFPYRPLPQIYSFDFRAARGARGNSDDSLWHAFIDEVMRRRHSIAHGDTMANDTSVTELNHDIDKMNVLMHGVLYSAATYLSKHK